MSLNNSVCVSRKALHKALENVDRKDGFAFRQWKPMLIFLFIVPVGVNLVALLMGTLLAKTEIDDDNPSTVKWTWYHGFLYVITNLCGLGNPLTDATPHGRFGKILDFYISFVSTALNAFLIGVVGRLAIVDRAATKYDSLFSSGNRPRLAFFAFCFGLLPLFYLLSSCVFGAILGAIEGWGFKGGFFYIASNLAAMANPLTSWSPDPENTFRTLFAVFVSIFALLLTGTATGVVINLRAVGSAVGYLESFIIEHDLSDMIEIAVDEIAALAKNPEDDPGNNQVGKSGKSSSVVHPFSESREFDDPKAPTAFFDETKKNQISSPSPPAGNLKSHPLRNDIWKVLSEDATTADQKLLHLENLLGDFDKTSPRRRHSAINDENLRRPSRKHSSINQKRPSALPPPGFHVSDTEHLPKGFGGAVILDSGTGESKLLFAEETDDGLCEMTELKVLPSLCNIQMNSEFETILQDYEGLCTPASKPSPLYLPHLNASASYISQCLSDPPPHPLPIHIDSMKAALKERPGSVGIAGLTAWFRNTTEADKCTARKFFRERLPDVTVVELEGAEEGMFEAAAVNYAADKCGIGRPNLQLAAGGGSINIVYDHEAFNIECGFRAGTKELMVNGLASIPVLEKAAVQAVTVFKDDDCHFAFDELTEGVVIAISACYYAAKGVGIADAAHGVEAHEVVKAFTKRRQQVLDTVTCDHGKITCKKTAQEIANLTLQTEVFRLLVHPNAKVYFRRDWVIQGVQFRTTWSSGYFIKHFLKEEKCKCYHPWDDLVSKASILKVSPKSFNSGPARKGSSTLESLVFSLSKVKSMARRNRVNKQNFNKSPSFNANHWGSSFDDDYLAVD